MEVVTLEDPRFDQGLYTVREAARLARVPPNTLWNWVRGYAYPTSQGTGRAKPVLAPPREDGKPALAFVNLMEALALAGFRQTGVSMQRVRKALEYAKRAMDEAHPLANQRILTDGRDLFWEYQKRRDPEVHLVNMVKGGQKAFPEAVERYLREVEWGRDRYAVRWWPGAREAGAGDIVVDPKRAFGAPVVARTGIKTEDVFDRFSAGEPMTELAEDYGLTLAQIEAAIRAEARFLEPIPAAA
ncbi:MAG: DUF433 domain-containing protein [Actinomycetota bacterium]